MNFLWQSPMRLITNRKIELPEYFLSPFFVDILLQRSCHFRNAGDRTMNSGIKEIGYLRTNLDYEFCESISTLKFEIKVSHFDLRENSRHQNKDIIIRSYAIRMLLHPEFPVLSEIVVT